MKVAIPSQIRSFVSRSGGYLVLYRGGRDSRNPFTDQVVCFRHQYHKQHKHKSRNPFTDQVVCFEYPAFFRERSMYEANGRNPFTDQVVCFARWLKSGHAKACII